MKKIVIAVIIIASLMLVACTSKTEEVDALIESGDYAEAAKLIKENQLNKEDDKYQTIIDTYELSNELRELLDQKKYEKVIEKYIEQPVQDSVMKKEIHSVLKDTFEIMIEKDYLRLAKENFDKLDDETKKSLKDSQKLISDAENIQKEKEEEQKKAMEEKNKQLESELLKYMQEGKYSEVADLSFRNGDNRIKNLYNLSSAYDWFYSNKDESYAVGIESIPESLLKEIINPSPEVQKFMDELLKIIKEKQTASSSNYGVYIGMTKEQVLASSWGEPEKINKTTTAYGTSEQWVYPGFQFLYFENDILVSIQNNE
ncbi:hypothetical protein J9303_16350 [Bacillaceae bacterium Marseille-Q3522]|nr:hypothetical protein [Bacillaceae bacterium Marseille-Q3522]